MPETFFGDSETQYMIDTFGVPATIGATSAKVIVDRRDEEMMRMGWTEYIGKAIILTVKTNAFLALAREQVVTITGSATTYKVRQIMQTEDGGITTVLCAVD